MTTAPCARRVFFVAPPLLPAVLAVVLVSSGVSDNALAQRSTTLPQTRLEAVFPSGGQTGTSFDVRVTKGSDLDDLKRLVFNHPGLKAVPKKASTDGKQPPANTFVVSIADDVPVGLYEVRAAGKFGLSNPRTFVVGRLNETVENEANNTQDAANPLRLNQTVNGVISATTDIDVFKFDGGEGQRVVLDCRAARIDSQLEATLELYTSRGRRIGYAHTGLRGDPVLAVTLPADDTYHVKLFDFTYRNGSDYFYRLSVHTQPHIAFVLPPAGVPGTTGTFTLYGHNLPEGQPSRFQLHGETLQKLDVQIRLPAEPTLQPAENLSPREAGLDAIRYVLKSGSATSNPVQIYLAEAPVVLEQEPNDSPQAAQKISLPAEVCGQFQSPGDVDYVTFAADAKDVYYIEVASQRLGTSADPFLKIEQITKNKQGEESVRTITTSDDSSDNAGNSLFNITSDDPVVRFQVPATGTYRIGIRDRYADSRGYPGLVYRLCIRKPKPDFRAAVLPITPSTQRNQPETSGVLALRRGENLLARVFVFRRDGFDGPVEITADGLPPGVQCKGTVIGKGQTGGLLVFRSDETAAEWSGLIRIVATARVEDPAAVQQVAEAQSVVKSAGDALPKLRKAVQTAETPLKKAQQQLAQAKAAVAKKPDDKTLAAKVSAEQKQVDALQKKLDAAKAALAEGEQRLSAAQSAQQKATQQREAAVRIVTRDARPATVVWDPVNNQSDGLARVAQSLGLSVMNETAPVQLTTGIHRVEVNSGRQVLVPLQLARREGFNGKKDVNVTFDGLPKNSNIQIENKPIKQGQDSELYRIFVTDKAKPGIYVIYPKAQAPVSYRKNLDELKRAQAEQKTATKTLQDATAALKTANAKRDAAAKQAAADAEAVKQATAAQQQAQKKLAAAKAAAAKTSDDPKLKAAVASAQTQFDAAEKSLQAAQAKAKASADEKAKAEAVAKTAAEQAKAAEAAKKAIDQKVKNLNNVAKPRNLTLNPTGSPVILEVKASPAAVSASVVGGGKVKRGGQLAIKVTIKRQNGFEGPVTLSLPLPPGIDGLSAPEVTIPADKSEGVLTVQVGNNATTGQLKNIVVRATMEFDGKAAVDAPIPLNVSK